MLIVHMQGWGDALGDDAGPKAARGGPSDAALENQLHLVWAAQVEVLADRGFKEQPAGEWPVQDLGQGEFGLQDRNFVVISGDAVSGRQRLWQARQPLAYQRFDLLGRQAIGQRLHAGRVGTRE